MIIIWIVILIIVLVTILFVHNWKEYGRLFTLGKYGPISKSARIIIGLSITALAVLLAFALFFFSPRQRFKRELGKGNLGTANTIYEQMSPEDQVWAEKYMVEAAGNALGNLF